MKISRSLWSACSVCLLALLAMAAPASEPLAILSVGPDTGVSPTDGITNASTLTIVGQGGVGETVTFRLGSVVIGTMVPMNGQGNVDNDGDGVIDGPQQWRFSTSATTPLVSGQHVLTATTGAGPGTRSSAYTILVDLVVPTAPTFSTVTPDTGVSATDWVTSASTVTVNGRSEARSIVSMTIGGLQDPTSPTGVFVATAVTSASGIWSVPLQGLRAGTFSLEISAMDLAGNVSLPASQTLRIEAPPVPTIATMSLDTGIRSDDRITKDVTQTLGGIAAPNATVTLMREGRVVGSGRAHATTGAWTATTSALTDGPHLITAVATYGANGLASAPSEPFALTIKTLAIAPTITITPDNGTPDDGITNVNALIMSGQAGDAVSLSLSLDSRVIGVPTITNGTWMFDWSTRPIDPGIHALVVTANDLAGNQTAAVLNLIIDVIPPGAPIIESTIPGPAGTTNLGVVIRTLEPGQRVQLVLDDVEVGTPSPVDPATSTSTQFINVAPGLHRLKAFAVDLAGNVGPASDPIDVGGLLQLPAPTEVFVGINGIPTTSFPNGTSPTAYGRASIIPGANIAVFIDGSQVQMGVVVSPDGTWEAALPAPRVGSHSLSAALYLPSVQGAPPVYGPQSIPFSYVIDGVGGPQPVQIPAILSIAGVGQPPGTPITEFMEIEIIGASDAAMSPAGASIEVMVNGRVAAQTQADARGNWIARLPPQRPGVIEVGARIVTAAGPGPISPIQLRTIEGTSLPVIVLPAPPSGIMVIGDGIQPGPIPQGIAWRISGVADPGAQLAISVNELVVGSAQSNSFGQWSFRHLGQPVGQYTVTARASVGPLVSPPSQPLSVTVTPIPFQGSIVTFNVQATVTRIDDTRQNLGGSIAIGMPLNGSIRYRSGVPDGNPVPSVGEYLFVEPSVGFDMQAGIVRLLSDPMQPLVRMTLRDEPLTDSYRITSTRNVGDVVPGLQAPSEITFIATDATGRALTSDRLSTAPPIPFTWQNMMIVISGFSEQGGPWTIEARVNQLIQGGG